MEAATHSYLGNTLESVPYSLAHEVEDGREFDIILIGFKDIVLFPYETIPLRISNETWTDINTVRSQHSNMSPNLIGIVNISKQSHEFASIGTLVSIKSKGATAPRHTNDVVSGSSGGDWAITAYGRRRFHVKQMWHWRSLRLASVVILAEDFHCPLGNFRPTEGFSSNNNGVEGSANQNRDTRGIEHAFPNWVNEARSSSCLARRIWVSLLNSHEPCGVSIMCIFYFILSESVYIYS